MAFGRLVNKFQILDRKIHGSLRRVAAVVMACARLHNFIIKRDGLFDTTGMSRDEEEYTLEINRSNHGAPLGMSYLPTVPDDSFFI